VCGVGMSLQEATLQSNGCCVVSDIKSGRPVALSGKVRVGDRLVRAGDMCCVGVKLHVIKTLVVGPAGSSVELEFARGQGAEEQSIIVELLRYGPPALGAPPQQHADAAQEEEEEAATREETHVHVLKAKAEAEEEEKITHELEALAAAEREEDEKSTVQASVKEGITAPLVDAPKAGDEAAAAAVQEEARAQLVEAQSDLGKGGAGEGMEEERSRSNANKETTAEQGKKGRRTTKTESAALALGKAWLAKHAAAEAQRNKEEAEVQRNKAKLAQDKTIPSEVKEEAKGEGRSNPPSLAEIEATAAKEASASRLHEIALARIRPAVRRGPAKFELSLKLHSNFLVLVCVCVCVCVRVYACICVCEC
jgi:hypothetical protein